MKKYEQRQIAAGAARSLLRKIGPVTGSETVEDAWGVLEELSRTPQNRDLIAVQWFRGSDNHQYKLFAREWRRWQRKSRQDADDLAQIEHINGIPFGGIGQAATGG